MADGSGPEEVVAAKGGGGKGLVDIVISIGVKEADHFLSGHPEVRVELEGFKEEVRRSPGDVGRNERFDGDCFDLPFEIGLRFSLPRSVPSQHLVEDHSDRPDVAFRAIQVVVQGLQGHIHWRPHVVVAGLLEVSVFDGKTEVCNFDFAFAEEDVGWLEVAMDDAEPVDTAISIDNFFQDILSLLLWNSLPGLDHFS